MAKRRSIKVYGQSGYKYQETPTIMLKGMWLRVRLSTLPVQKNRRQTWEESF